MIADTDRSRVKALAGVGLSVEEIATIVDCGLKPHEIAKQCAREIAMGEATAKASLRQKLFTEARGGNSQALLHLVKEQDRNADLCDSAELCSILCCSRETLSDLVKRGVIERVARGLWDRKQCIQRYITHLRAVASGRSSGDGASVDLSLERALLAREQRISCEMDNDVKRGNLLRIEDVRETMAKLVKILVRNVATLGDRVERDKRVAPEIVVYIEGAVGQIRDEIAAEMDREFAD